MEALTCPHCGRDLGVTRARGGEGRYTLWPTCRPCKITYRVAQWTTALGASFILGEGPYRSNWDQERAGVEMYPQDHPNWRAYLAFLGAAP